jgi:integrase
MEWEGMAGLTPKDSIFGSKAESTSKSSPDGDVGSSPLCPQCGSNKLWRDAKRYSAYGDKIKRWLCRHCGLRFSDPNDIQKAKKALRHVETVDTKSLKRRSGIVFTRQICVTETKNLAAEQQTTEVLRRKATEDIKGKIVEYAFWMQKQNYSPETIRLNRTALKVLTERGANILDIEDVKKVISEQKWGDNRRRNVINAYSLFLKLNGMQWEKPKCKVTQKIPFIPTEQEIDALIASSGKKLATFLLLLKETAMRCGEAKRLTWTDIDFERRIVMLNAPEKHSNPRMWRVNAELITMLRSLPKEKSQKVFGEASIDSMKSMLLHARKRLAFKMQNPRFQKISFHTFAIGKLRWNITAPKMFFTLRTSLDTEASKTPRFTSTSKTPCLSHPEMNSQ